MEDVIKIHLNQAQGTPCTVSLMSILLGQDIFTPIGDKILKGTTDIKDLHLSHIQKKFFLSPKRKHIFKLIPNTLSRASKAKKFQK